MSLFLLQGLFYSPAVDNPGIALFLDFKKAFDSLEWNFIEKALETFNFGAPLVQWVNTFYSNIFIAAL